METAEMFALVTDAMKLVEETVPGLLLAETEAHQNRYGDVIKCKFDSVPLTPHLKAAFSNIWYQMEIYPADNGYGIRLQCRWELLTGGENGTTVLDQFVRTGGE
jgi:hypothetical protein